MPLLHVEIARQFTGAEPETQSLIPLLGYDAIKIDGKWNRRKNKSVWWNFKAQTLLLRDSRRLLPDMAVVLGADKSSGRTPTRLRWHSRDGLGIWWENPKKHRLRVGNKEMHPLVTSKQSVGIEFIMLGSLYTAKDMEYFGKLWSNCFTELTAEKGVVKNKCDLPLVKIVKLPVQTKLPFAIKEHNTWYFRGAQPADKKNDFVKCYLSPGKSAVIQRWGYINSLVKTAPGSQYAVSMKEVKDLASGCKLGVEISGISPAVNPSLDFVKPIASARINGKSWHVYDHKRLYLPKAMCSYSVEVIFGNCSQPHIIATQAHIKQTKNNDGSFVFSAALPMYCFKLAPSIHFYAAIRIPQCSKVTITGGQLVDRRDNILIVKFKLRKQKDSFVTIDF